MAHRRQDSGQPPPGSPGDPLSDSNQANHPGMRKQHEADAGGGDADRDAPAEGNDPSLTRGPTRRREAP